MEGLPALLSEVGRMRLGGSCRLEQPPHLVQAPQAGITTGNLAPGLPACNAQGSC
jgi:hypothetical protein